MAYGTFCHQRKLHFRVIINHLDCPLKLSELISISEQILPVLRPKIYSNPSSKLIKRKSAPVLFRTTTLVFENLFSRVNLLLSFEPLINDNVRLLIEIVSATCYICCFQEALCVSNVRISFHILKSPSRCKEHFYLSRNNSCVRYISTLKSKVSTRPVLVNF